MIKIFCDHCRKEINIWQVKIIGTKWGSDESRQIGEICDICELELEKFLNKGKK